MTDLGIWEPGKTEKQNGVVFPSAQSQDSKFWKGNMKKKLYIDFIQSYNFTFFASSQIFNMIALYHFENHMYNSLTVVVRRVKVCFPLKPLF